MDGDHLCRKNEITFILEHEQSVPESGGVRRCKLHRILALVTVHNHHKFTSSEGSQRFLPGHSTDMKLNEAPGESKEACMEDQGIAKSHKANSLHQKGSITARKTEPTFWCPQGRLVLPLTHRFRLDGRRGSDDDL